MFGCKPIIKIFVCNKDTLNLIATTSRSREPVSDYLVNTEVI